jgi:acyl carrier protein
VTREELRAAVLGALAKVAPELDPASIAPDKRLRDQVDLDSVDFLNFLVELHNATGVDVPDAHYAQVQTLDECIAYLAPRTVPASARRAPPAIPEPLVSGRSPLRPG